MSMHDLWALEKHGHLMYGTPLGPKDLDHVVLPDGRLGPGIRPSLPTTWDFERRQFVPHFTQQPQVCAGTLAALAVVRGLGQQHPQLTVMERSHGWTIVTNESGELHSISLFATEALITSIKRKGSGLVSWLYDLGQPAHPFQPAPQLPFEYRSPLPAAVHPGQAHPISGTWFPADQVKVIKPFNQYENEADWRADLGLPPQAHHSAQTCAFAE